MSRTPFERVLLGWARLGLNTPELSYQALSYASESLCETKLGRECSVNLCLFRETVFTLNVEATMAKPHYLLSTIISHGVLPCVRLNSLTLVVKPNDSLTSVF